MFTFSMTSDTESDRMHKEQTGIYSDVASNWHFLQENKHPNVLYLMLNLQEGTKYLESVIAILKTFISFLSWCNNS